MRTLLSILVLGLFLAFLLIRPLPQNPLTARAEGPGLLQRTYTDDELFTIISRINGEHGAPLSHGTMSMHQGYLVVIYARGSGAHDGGFAFFDISDPYNPKLVASKDDDETFDLREAHGYGYTRLGGRDYVALQSITGVQFWDWTDITNPVRVSTLDLPGITKSDYSTANWWTSWQAPYLYVGGTGNGIYIVDTRDPAAPVLADRGELPNPMPISQTGGFRIGPIFAVGNLLVVGGNDVQGYSTLDISDPLNPVLLDTLGDGSSSAFSRLLHSVQNDDDDGDSDEDDDEDSEAPNNYSAFVNGGRIYGAGRFSKLYVHDISDPTQITAVGHVENTGDKGGYISVQDGFVHMGASTNYVKVDVRDEANMSIVGWASSNIADADEDFATVLGNLVVLSDDHNNGSFLIPHQKQPDTTGPAVNMVIPADGAVQQRQSSRIGLTFSDLVDLRTVYTGTVSVRPVNGEPLAGRYSHQTNILNFTPDQPLQPNTSYIIEVPAGGVRDIAGNATETDFVSYFTTGSTLSVPPTCRLDALDPVAVGQPAQLNGELLASQDGEIRYYWIFGDNKAPSEPAGTIALSHTYEKVGHYNVQLVMNQAASDDSTLEGRCAGRITVHHPITENAPATASTILLDRRCDRVWNVNPDNNSVSVINAATLHKAAEYPVGPHPTSLTQTPDNAIWVVNRDNATLTIVDAAAQVPISRTVPVSPTLRSAPFDVILPVGSQPQSIVTSPDGRWVYVTLQATGALLQIDPFTRQVVDSLDVGPTPRGLAVTANSDRIYVTRFISPDPWGEVVEVATDPLRVVKGITLRYDPGPDTESSSRGLPNALHGITISPDGRSAWVPSKKDNTARGLTRDGQPLTFDSSVRTIVSQIDLSSGYESIDARHDFEDRSMAVAVAFSPLGDYGFVALQGSNAVGVLDAYRGTLATTLDDVGAAPAGLALSADGRQLFVHSFLTRSVSVYDIHSILDNAIGANTPLARVPVVADEQLSPAVLQGKRIFYSAADGRMSRDGYISCAACHLDEGDDGRVWDRTDAGEGLRNTTSLLGRSGTRQGLLHWSANFDEIQDFEHDARELFGGLGFLSDADYAVRSPLGLPKAELSADLDALAAYVASLRSARTSPYRPASGELTAAGEAGRILFRSAGCAACHSSPQFTDSPAGLRHDVGTLASTSGSRSGVRLLGLDTPTLRGLWETPPYLHDGSAPTLRHVLVERNGAGLHGSTADLSEAEIDQLIAYLLQIDDLEPDAPGIAPAITLRAPEQRSRFAPGASVPLQATTLAVDQLPAPVVQVEFYADDALLGADVEAPYEMVWRPAEGTYRLAAHVLYASGARSASAEVSVQVGSAEPTPPTGSGNATPMPVSTPVPVSTPMPPASVPQPAAPLPGGYADADRDGLPDLAEDRDGNGNPLDDDTDGDGKPDFQDRDDDGDTLATRDELAVQTGDAGIPLPRDSDGDGAPDYLDADDDNDGWPTSLEAADGNPVDHNADGTPDHLDPAAHPDGPVPGSELPGDGERSRIYLPFTEQ